MSKKVIKTVLKQETILDAIEIIESYKLKGEEAKNATHFSFGCLKGCYDFSKLPTDELYNYVIQGKLSSYCFVEKKTEYFKLFIDFDIKNVTTIEKIKSFCGFDLFWDTVIGLINEVLLNGICDEGKIDELLHYIYSDKSDNYKERIHLYYPNIIINTEFALGLRKHVIMRLLNIPQLNLDPHECEELYDENVYNKNCSALRFLFMSKPGFESKEKIYYKLNKEKSTYNFSTKKIEQLKVTSFRTNNTSMNIKEKIFKRPGSILSYKYFTEFIPKKKVSEVINNKYEIKSFENEDPEKDKLENDEISLEHVKRLFSILSVKRADDRTTWMYVLLMCSNYIRRAADEITRKTWIKLGHDFSKKSKKYDSNETQKILFAPLPINRSKLGKNKDGLLTTASLLEWAEKDNPLEFKKIYIEFFVPKVIKTEIKSNITEVIDINNKDIIYNEDFLQKLDTYNNNCFIIKSATGTNKSGEIIKTITNIEEEHHKKVKEMNIVIDSIANIVKEKCEMSISVISSRVVLASNLFGRFNQKIYGEEENRPSKLEMVCYDEIPKHELKNYKRIIQTPDSLIHMFDYGELRIPDIVFIDEIQSMFDYITSSDTLKLYRKKVYNILNTYIAKAKYVFTCDSNVDKVIVEHIKSLRTDNKVQVIYNMKKTNNNDHIILHKNEWIDKIINFLNKDKKIYIACDSKTFTDRFEPTIREFVKKGLKILIINSETDDSLKKKLREPNTLFNGYDIVVVSPTVLYGIDFSIINYFDYIFGNYNTTLTAQAIYQQLNRIRSITSKEVFLTLDYKGCYRNMPTTYKDLEKFIFRYQEDYKTFLERTGYSEIGCELPDNKFTKLYMHFEIERNKNNNDFIGMLAFHLTEFGGRLINAYNKFYEKVNEIDHKKIKEKEKEKKIKNIIKASGIELERFEEARDKNEKTTEDKKILEAEKIMKSFNIQKVNKLFLEKMGHINNIENFKSSAYEYLEHVKLKNTLNNNTYEENNKRISLKTIIVNEAIELFFKTKDGIFTKFKTEEGEYTKHAITYLKGKQFSKKEFEWKAKREKDIKKLFPSCKRQKVEKYLTFINLIKKLITEYYGGFITVEKVTKRTIKNDFHCYILTGVEGYLELLLNKYTYNIKSEIISKASLFCGDKECVFEELHGFSKLNDIKNYIYLRKKETEVEEKKHEKEIKVILNGCYEMYKKKSEDEYVDESDDNDDDIDISTLKFRDD